jgi:hypothetical protein
MARFAFVTVVTYFVAWTVWFIAIMGTDFQYYFPYMRLAWSSPGEIPFFIQAFSVSSAIFLIGAYYVCRWLRSR